MDDNDKDEAAIALREAKEEIGLDPSLVDVVCTLESFTMKIFLYVAKMLIFLVGLSRSLQATSRKSTITNPSAGLNIGSADCPRYRAIDMKVIEHDTDFGCTLTDEHGRVEGIWGSFSTQLKYGGSTSEDHQFVRGIPVYTISQVLDKILSGANGPPLLINTYKWH